MELPGWPKTAPPGKRYTPPRRWPNVSDDKFMSELGEFIKKRGEPGSDEDLFPTSITV
jgi:hypothetical protein